MGADDDAKALLKTMKETTKEMGKQKSVYDSIAGVTKKIRAGSEKELVDSKQWRVVVIWTMPTLTI